MVEVINPETGEVVDDDTEGELVFTAFDSEAMTLIRYRTHDISLFVKQVLPHGILEVN